MLLLVARFVNNRFALWREYSCAVKALQSSVWPPGGSSSRQSSLLPWTTTNWKWNYCQSIERMKLCHIIVRRGKEIDRWATGADRVVLKEEGKKDDTFILLFLCFILLNRILPLSFTSPIPLFLIFPCKLYNGCIRQGKKTANWSACCIRIKISLFRNKRKQ